MILVRRHNIVPSKLYPRYQQVSGGGPEKPRKDAVMLSCDVNGGTLTVIWEVPDDH